MPGDENEKSKSRNARSGVHPLEKKKKVACRKGKSHEFALLKRLGRSICQKTREGPETKWRLDESCGGGRDAPTGSLA